MATTISPRTDGLYIVWDDCKATWPIRHYTVIDDWAQTTNKCLTEQLLLTRRPAGMYTFRGYATDIFDNVGSMGNTTINIAEPATPEPVVNFVNGSMRISWAAVTSGFPVAKYQVYDGSMQLYQEVTGTFFDVQNPTGEIIYSVRAVDTAGNTSGFGTCVFTVAPPAAPTVTVAVEEVLRDNSKIRNGLRISWVPKTSMLPIAGYDVWRQWVDNNETKEESYGRVNAETLVVEATKASNMTFFVRPVDSAGNIGAAGYTDFTVRSPGAVSFGEVSVIDNNILLYWTEPRYIFFSIDHYMLSSVLTDGTVKEIGRVDALFAARFESEAGDFTYQVEAVDVAGNRGTPSQLTAKVSEPPDYVLYASKNSLFDGTSVNMAVEDSVMVGPVVVGETWQENIDRCVAAAIGTSASTLTWQEKIGDNALHFMSPPQATGSYVEVVDYGQNVPATRVLVSITSKKIEGDTDIHCKIETSSDSLTWNTLVDGGTYAFAGNFRYVRYTLTFTGGMVAITSLNFCLDMKHRRDNGTVYCSATDNGPNYETDSHDVGTWVPFNVSFMDVEQPISVQMVDGHTDNHPIVIFEDTPSPKGFRIAVYSNSGQRTDGKVQWTVQGY